MTRRLLKLLITLIFLAVVGLTGYAYLGDMSPEQVEVDEAVTLETE